MEKGKAVMGVGRRWAVDFSDFSSSRDLPDPPGFSRSSLDQDDSTVSRQKKDAEANWKAQKAWEVAQAPFKNLMMMGFMMWMAGSTVHLFSIGITFSALWQPISALQGVGKVFEPYKDNKVDLLAQKLVFIALNLVGLALGVWKLNTLGLLPTHPSDWVSSLPPAPVRLLNAMIHLLSKMHNITALTKFWILLLGSTPKLSLICHGFLLKVLRLIYRRWVPSNCFFLSAFQEVEFSGVGIPLR